MFLSRIMNVFMEDHNSPANKYFLIARYDSFTEQRKIVILWLKTIWKILSAVHSVFEVYIMCICLHMYYVLYMCIN